MCFLSLNRSRSLYGSSEIFDANAADGTYFNLDSDIDIPPLDSDDVLSDGRPNSPFVASLGRTKGDSNKARNAFFASNDGVGASMLKQRPYSSIILRHG